MSCPNYAEWEVLNSFLSFLHGLSLCISAQFLLFLLLKIYHITKECCRLFSLVWLATFVLGKVYINRTQRKANEAQQSTFSTSTQKQTGPQPQFLHSLKDWMITVIHKLGMKGDSKYVWGRESTRGQLGWDFQPPLQRWALLCCTEQHNSYFTKHFWII